MELKNRKKKKKKWRMKRDNRDNGDKYHLNFLPKYNIIDLKEIAKSVSLKCNEKAYK